MISPESASPTDSSFLSTGLFATARLVGREKQISQVEKIIFGKTLRSQVVAIIDEGGSGKTSLLKGILERLRKEPKHIVDEKGIRLAVLAAREPVDFYLMAPHIRYGLADSLYRTLELSEGVPPEFARLRDEVERDRALGDTTGVVSKRDEAVKKFVEYLKIITKKRRVVIALDTAERLLYQIPNIPKFISDEADSWKWLLEILGSLDNIVVILAGRSPTRQLLEKLPIECNEIELGPLSETECIEYFDVLAETARLDQKEAEAIRVAQVTREQRRLVHKLSRGKPISLSLYADLIALDSDPPDSLKMLLAEVRSLSRAELDQLRNKLDKQLIERLMERGTLGETIRAIGRAPRGVNIELLTRLLETTREITEQRLEEFSRLSIARRRTPEKRVDDPDPDRILERWFLHDEMYQLLREYVYNSLNDVTEAAEAGGIIQEYYQDRIATRRQELNERYRLVEREEVALHLPRLSAINAHLRNLLTEDAYYYLKYNPREGFRTYYRYSRQATLSGETEIDFRLQAVLLEYLAESEADAKPNPGAKLDRGQVFGIIAMRPIVRDWAEGRYPDALEHIKRYRAEGQDILEQGAPNSLAILDVWEAYVLTTIGKSPGLKRARAILDRVIQELESIVAREIAQDLKTDKEWRTKAILALAYRVSGYLHRIRGYLQNAARDYRKAARLWRELDILVEEGETRNGLSYALTLLGEFDDAYALVDDAIALREELGPRYPVGLSVNTKSLVSLYDGDFDAAVSDARRALDIFEKIEHARGIGLAKIALAEALRRQTEDLQEIDEKIEQFREARGHAREALDIFEGKIKEQVHQVEALIEVGCAERDWAFLLRLNKPSNKEILEHTKSSKGALEKAASLAGVTLRYRRVDALVNLAWLGHYTGNERLANNSAAQAKRVIPRAYYINNQTGRPQLDADAAEALLWGQLGKLYALFGERAFDIFHEQEKKKSGRDDQAMHRALEQAAENYTIGLAYNHLLSHTHREIRRTENRIYKHVKNLNPKELQRFAEKVIAVEKQMNLGASAMRELLQDRAVWFGD